jgi:thiopeptide-type bacteriocin biosynthesis protein
MILKSAISEYVGEMVATGIIDKWFFIRYSDPDFHIRLRLHLKETRNFSFALNRFFEIFNPLAESGFVWDVQCNTYQREMERYGADSVSLVEDLFFADSAHILPLLRLLSNDNAEQQRWRLALVLIDSFLSAFSFDISQRKELLNTMAESSKKEFGYIHRNVTKPLNDKYRAFRKDIENAMLYDNEASEIVKIIQARKLAIMPIAEKLTDLKKTGELQVSMESLLTSMIHMTMNRWYRAKNRLHEMVIYEFLSRYYTSTFVKTAFFTS